MSLFIKWVANVTYIDYFGLIIAVPNNYMENGYIAMDGEGDVWVYKIKPEHDDHSWHAPTLNAANNCVCVLEMNIYGSEMRDLDDSELALDISAKSLRKISECPVVNH